jgi:hypothetical protein
MATTVATSARSPSTGPGWPKATPKAGDLDAARAILDHVNAAAEHAESVRLRRRVDAVVNLISRRTGKRTAHRPSTAG